MAAVCRCGHPQPLHEPGGCRLNGCRCEGFRDVAAAIAPDAESRRLTIDIPAGFYATVAVYPVDPPKEVADGREGQ